MSVRSAKPDSRALNLRRLVGGGEWDGLEEPGFGLLTGLELAECLRFVVGRLNHGWRIGVEVAKVAISVSATNIVTVRAGLADTSEKEDSQLQVKLLWLKNTQAR